MLYLRGSRTKHARSTHEARKNAYAAALENITQRQSAAFHTALSPFATASTYYGANTTTGSEKAISVTAFTTAELVKSLQIASAIHQATITKREPQSHHLFSTIRTRYNPKDPTRTFY